MHTGFFDTLPERCLAVSNGSVEALEEIAVSGSFSRYSTTGLSVYAIGVTVVWRSKVKILSDIETEK